MNPDIAITILFAAFMLLIMVKYPITLSMIISIASAMLYIQVPVMTSAQRMSKQFNSFSLLAIPFFIPMGEIMTAGGISSHLLAFTDVRMGQIIGGLVYANALVPMLLGGISGSAIADVSSLGALETPMMEEIGYEKDFSIAATVTNSCQGLITSLNHNMVLYSMAAGGVSVGGLFYAGHILGIMSGAFIMVICYTISKKKRYPKGKKLPSEETLRVTRDTFFAILVVVIIIGGISAGSFIATESMAIPCTYCLLIGFFVYRELHPEDTPVVLGNTIKVLSMVYALVAAAGVFGRMVVHLNVPALITNLFLGISDNKTVVPLPVNLILPLLGRVIDLTPLTFIIASILPPVVTKFGMNPTQFGIMMTLNLGIGLCMLPVGTVLFTGCAVGNMKIEKISKAMLLLYIPILIMLLLVTFIPAPAMTLPELITK